MQAPIPLIKLVAKPGLTLLRLDNILQRLARSRIHDNRQIAKPGLTFSKTKQKLTRCQAWNFSCRTKNENLPHTASNCNTASSHETRQQIWPQFLPTGQLVVDPTLSKTLTIWSQRFQR